MIFRVRSLGGSLASDLHPSNPIIELDCLAATLRRHSTDAALHAEIQNLNSENDSELRAEGLLSLAQRQEMAGRADIAGEIYATVGAASGVEAVSSHARERLAVLQGNGPLGARFEVLARHFARQASDPAMLGGMLVGGAVFQTVRLATLSRLAASPTASLLTRGLGARALSWGTGLAFEIPAFTFAIRGLNEAMGRPQEWTREAVSRDLLVGGITLFMLKGSGAAGSAATRRLVTAEGTSSAFVRFSAGAIPQAAAFSGILGSHVLEARLGLRPHSDAGNTLMDSLATLLQFHVGGRLLRGATGNGYERRLEILSRGLEEVRLSQPRPPSSFLGSLLPNSTYRPALAGEVASLFPDTVFMSSNNNSGASPSNRPPPLLEVVEGSRGRVVPHPAQLRDLKTEIDHVDRQLYAIFRNEAGSGPWDLGARESSRALQEIAEELHFRIRQEPARGELLPYLEELGLEYRTIENLLDRAEASGRPLPGRESLDIHRFFTYFIRSSNNLINFIDHNALVQQPIENARRARSWLQRGLEGDAFPSAEISTIHPESPYERLADGSFRLTRNGLHIVVVGDENAPRTFQLSDLGHRVTHVADNESSLRTTERRLQYRAQRARESGEFTAVDPMVAFRTESGEIPPADLIEAYFPRQLAELAPRSSETRQETLQDFLHRQLKGRLAPGGTAFVIADRDEAIEDLANLVLRDRSLELLEVRQRRTHLPLMGGNAISIEPGEAMVSWLLFRRLGN